MFSTETHVIHNPLFLRAYRIESKNKHIQKRHSSTIIQKSLLLQKQRETYLTLKDYHFFKQAEHKIHREEHEGAQVTILHLTR